MRVEPELLPEPDRVPELEPEAGRVELFLLPDDRGLDPDVPGLLRDRGGEDARVAMRVR
jgi:hypothetical protein